MKRMLLATAGCVSVLLAFIVVRGWTAQNARPRLAISFIGCTNDVGANRAIFSVTNTGNAGAICFVSASVEVQDPPATFSTGYGSSVNELRPGRGGIVTVSLPAFFAGRRADKSVDVFLPPSFPGRWRVKCFWARAGLRYRCNVWHGRGEMVRKLIPVRFIPRYFTQIPLDVVVTSDWIAP
jgi:hypothetical protein